MDYRGMPKVELHAHLNGSLSNRTLMELHKDKYGNDKITSDSYTIFAKELLSMDNCFEKFKYAHDLTDTKDRLRIATRRVIEEFLEENTIYLELRSTPRGSSVMSKSEYIVAICEAILDAKQDAPGIIVTYIPSFDRAQSVLANAESLEEVLKARLIYPDVIVGLDLSGNPIAGDFGSLKPLLTKAKENGLKLTIHCAEVSGRAEETREILDFDAVRRIGHGTFLDETPQLWSLFQTKGVFVECCLSSNVKCGTVANYNDHHMKKLIQIRNPLAICTDDYGVFETTLSQEFEIATKSFELTGKDLERILLESVQHAFCSDSEKLNLAEQIGKYFGEILLRETK